MNPDNTPGGPVWGFCSTGMMNAGGTRRPLKIKTFSHIKKNCYISNIKLGETRRIFHP